MVTNYGTDKIGLVLMYTLLFGWFMVCSESNAILSFKMGKKQYTEMIGMRCQLQGFRSNQQMKLYEQVYKFEELSAENLKRQI